MIDEKRTKRELIRELAELRGRVAALEAEAVATKAGKAVPEHEEFLHLLIESTEDVILLYDLQGGALYYSGPSRYGMKSGDMLGKTPHEFFAKEEADVILSRNRKVASTGKSMTADLAVTLQGQTIWFSEHVFPVRDAAGRITGVARICRDITARRRVEAALLASEARYRQLVEETDNVVLQVDARGRLTFVNQAAERDFSISPVDCIGLPMLDYVHPGDRERTQQAIAQWIDRGAHSVTFENRLIHRAGEARNMLWTVTLREDEAGEGVLVDFVGHDITQRKQIEESLEERVRERTARLAIVNRQLRQQVVQCEQIERALRESERKYRELVENANSIILRMDAAGRVTFFNEFAEKFFGYAKDEILGQSCVGTIVPPRESSGRDMAELIRLLCSDPDRYQSHENENVRRDGARVWVSWTNKPVRNERGEVVEILCVGNDITARRRVEEELRESEERFRRALEEGPLGMVIGSVDGKMQQVNRAMCEMSGYSDEELHGRDPLEFSHPDDRETSLPLVQKLLGGEISSFTVEQRYLKRDGQVLWARVTTASVRDREGRVLYPLALVEDITRRKQAEEAVQKEQRLLRRLLDLHERERRMVAYEIHDGFAQLVTGAQMQLRSLDALRREVPAETGKTLDTVDQLLGQSIAEARRLISGLRPPILDESGIVAAIEYLAAGARGQGIAEIEFQHKLRFRRLAAPLESVIFRIVQESLTNVQRHSGSEKARITLVQKRSRVLIVVEDWGAGFDPEKVAQDHFGLQGIRERARLLGGRAVIVSAPGQGTRVCVELPVVKAVSQ